MYERIQGTGIIQRVHIGAGLYQDTEMFDIFDESMRHVLHTSVGIAAARAWLDNELKRERLSCLTGRCED